MFLTSWLKDGSREVVYVQNSDTNVVQRFTEQPNQNNLQLLELRSNLDPKLVEAVVSDGKEKGIVKFQFEAQAAAAQTFSPEVLAHNRTPPGYSPVPPGSQAAPQPVTTSANAQGALNAGSQPQGQPSLPQANSGSRIQDPPLPVGCSSLRAGDRCEYPGVKVYISHRRERENLTTQGFSR
jgi:hypothetical protein